MTRFPLDYRLFVTGLEARVVEEITVSEAKARFAQCMREMPEREGQFRLLMDAAGIDIDAPDWLYAVEQWCAAHAQLHERNERLLTPAWISIAWDISLHWGETIRALAPSVLSWRLDTMKRSITYSLPCLTGFPLADGAVLAPEFSPMYLVVMLCRKYASGGAMNPGGLFVRTDEIVRADLWPT